MGECILEYINSRWEPSFEWLPPVTPKNFPQQQQSLHRRRPSLPFRESQDRHHRPSSSPSYSPPEDPQSPQSPQSPQQDEMPSGSSKSKPKASEVAAETRRYYIPLIKKEYGDIYKTYSYLFPAPLAQLSFDYDRPFRGPPSFYVMEGDPVDMALRWGQQMRSEGGMPVPFICAANDKRPGGDWETGVVGYEERLCRRSNLSATLGTPAPETYSQSNYPIPIEGGILSETVVVFRGPHDRYDKLNREEWQALPVCSVPPVRWPKLTQGGTKYSFDTERDMVKNKLRAALKICVYKGYTHIVIGDFGLGNGYRNPPQEMAELWREVFLWDTELRGRIQSAAFVFEDRTQSTTRLILEDLSKKSRHGSSHSSSHSSSSSSSSKGKGKSSSSSSSSHSTASSIHGPSDYDIFACVFHEHEISRVLTQPDPRYGLGALMT